MSVNTSHRPAKQFPSPTPLEKELSMTRRSQWHSNNHLHRSHHDSRHLPGRPTLPSNMRKVLRLPRKVIITHLGMSGKICTAPRAWNDFDILLFQRDPFEVTILLEMCYEAQLRGRALSRFITFPHYIHKNQTRRPSIQDLFQKLDPMDRTYRRERRTESRKSRDNDHDANMSPASSRCIQEKLRRSTQSLVPPQGEGPPHTHGATSPALRGASARPALVSRLTKAPNRARARRGLRLEPSVPPLAGLPQRQEDLE